MMHSDVCSRSKFDRYCVNDYVLCVNDYVLCVNDKERMKLQYKYLLAFHMTNNRKELDGARYLLLCLILISQYIQ